MEIKQSQIRCKCPTEFLPIYTSVVTLAFGFVTLTPSCFARATISILFLDETACEILDRGQYNTSVMIAYPDVLCGKSLVVHEEEVDISGIVDQKSFVARGHHVAGLLVGSKANLKVLISIYRWCFPRS